MTERGSVVPALLRSPGGLGAAVPGRRKPLRPGPAGGRLPGLWGLLRELAAPVLGPLRRARKARPIGFAGPLVGPAACRYRRALGCCGLSWAAACRQRAQSWVPGVSWCPPSFGATAAKAGMMAPQSWGRPAPLTWLSVPPGWGCCVSCDRPAGRLPPDRIRVKAPAGRAVGAALTWISSGGRRRKAAGGRRPSILNQKG